MLCLRRVPDPTPYTPQPNETEDKDMSVAFLCLVPFMILRFLKGENFLLNKYIKIYLLSPKLADINQK